MPLKDKVYKMSATTNSLKQQAFLSTINNSSAFLEILKNSFDAEACKVIIKLYDNKIIIKDDGNGFSKIGFDSFTKVGKSSKRKNSKNRLGRSQTGINGSGAYSFIRLGKDLSILSKNSLENYEFSRFIDWDKIDQNPNADISELVFEERRIEYFGDFTKGVEFVIGSPFITNEQINNIHKDISFISLDSSFSYEINDKISHNIIDQLSELYKEEFCNFYFSFIFKNGKLELLLGNKLAQNKQKSITSYCEFNIVGTIYGEYISIQKKLTNATKKIKSHYESILEGDNDYKNNFYDNDMLVLSNEQLGLSFDKIFTKIKSGFKFINPFGYTAIKDTHLLFNPSRTTIVDDLNKQKENYIKIMNFIKNQVYKEFTKYVAEEATLLSNESDTSKSEHLKQEVFKIKQLKEANPELPKNFSNFVQLAIKTPQELLIDDIKNFLSKLSTKNKYYKALSQSSNEIILFLLNNSYLKSYNISFHSIVRVFCELCFIYIIYQLFTSSEDLEEIKKDALKKGKIDDFVSIGSLLNFANTNSKIQWKKLKDMFSKKTNLNNFNDTILEIQKINNHIHNPKDYFDSRISMSLIKKFMSWLI